MTADVHAEAESQPFIKSIFAGNVDKGKYTDYVYQSLVDPLIYGTIRIEQRSSVVQNAANLTSLRSNAAFTHANSGFIHANSAFDVANTGVAHTSPNPAIWNTSPPVDVANAIARLANAVYALRSNSPIP